MKLTHKIMLVDDDFIFLEMLKESLSDIADLEIDTARTGEECLKKLDDTHNAVVLDYFLDAEDPGAQNGMAILKQIRQSHPHVKVVILSGQDNGSLVYDFVRENIDSYVVKDSKAFENVRQSIQKIIGQ